MLTWILLLAWLLPPALFVLAGVVERFCGVHDPKRGSGLEHAMIIVMAIPVVGAVLASGILLLGAYEWGAILFRRWLERGGR